MRTYISLSKEHNIFDDLSQRQLISASTDPDALRKHMCNPIVAYCGFDPTASSLHIGHLVPILMLKRFQMYGHSTIALIGGATGLVGDPSGRSNERTLMKIEEVKERANMIQTQLQNLLLHSEDQKPTIFIDNYDWISNISTIEFLRDYGKHLSMKDLLSNRYVSARLNDPDTGISFTEFSYTILQALDFVHLRKYHNCTVQIGGNDQWGNITNGTRLARAIGIDNVYGFTLPLLLKSDGSKFGKTANGAIWLDSKLTPIFDFYQFWFSINDEDIRKLMYIFSLQSSAEIDALLLVDREDPSQRIAIRHLAYEMTAFVHGETYANACQTLAQILFSHSNQSDNKNNITANNWDALVFSGIVPTIPMHSLKDKMLSDALLSLGLVSSRKDAKRNFVGNSIKVNFSQITEDIPLKEITMLHNNMICLQKGKLCGLVYNSCSLM